MPRALAFLGVALLLFAGGSIALAASGRGPTLGPIELLLDLVVILAGGGLLIAGAVAHRSHTRGTRGRPDRDS